MNFTGTRKFICPHKIHRTVCHKISVFKNVAVTVLEINHPHFLCLPFFTSSFEFLQSKEITLSFRIT